MPPEKAPPDFESFARWVASRFGAGDAQAAPPAELVAAARDARAARERPATTASKGPQEGSPDRLIETLELLAAATTDDPARPPELVTGRGFRVSLAYEDADRSQVPSICVLVQCPAEWTRGLEGATAYLWVASNRWELGQFDADGKAIGLLPPGVRVTFADFSSGVVRLEAPILPTGD